MPRMIVLTKRTEDMHTVYLKIHYVSVHLIPKIFQLRI